MKTEPGIIVRKKTLVMGFDLYGAGNVGDDLMVAGFLEALSEPLSEGRLAVVGRSRWDVASQAGRFPGVRWQSAPAEGKTEGDCWAGVGGTPFQLSGGPWFLRSLERRLPEIAGYPSRVLVNVGAETEAAARADAFARVAGAFDRISTRDVHSAEVLTGPLGVDDARVCAGGDLANVSLARLFGAAPPERAYRLGVILAGEGLTRAERRAIGAFLSGRPGPIAFVAGEVRREPGFERDVYERLARWPWSRVRRRVDLRVPPYAHGSLADLAAPIAACETVVSSRYHGLLTAAWAGCRVAAVGRSSKVRALADVLGVPCADRPYTRQGLEEMAEGAAVVPRARLEPLVAAAHRGLAFALGGLLADLPEVD